MRISRDRLMQACTKSGHQLVGKLHLIDFKADKLTPFLLTPRRGRVKTQSFFDNF
jgi:hypothetical protein